MNRVLFDLGFIQIYWYSLCIFIGMFVGLFYVFKESKRLELDQDFIINMIFYTMIFGICGARLYYVLFNLPYYIVRPIEILEIWNGGLAIHGGMIAGLIFVRYYTHKHGLSLYRILDLIIPALLLGQIIGRWGNFFNQEAYGPIVTSDSLNYLPTFIKNNMLINGSYRMPLFLYESILNFIALITVLVIRKMPLLKNGYITSLYLVWYGVVRLILEQFRTDSLYFGSLRVAQFISLIMIVAGFIIFIINRRGRRLENLYNGEVVVITE